MREQIKELLKERGPVEVSVLYSEIANDSPTEVILTASQMSEAGELWWIHVPEEYAIVGLPEQPKPDDPEAFLFSDAAVGTTDAF